MAKLLAGGGDTHDEIVHPLPLNAEELDALDRLHAEREQRAESRE